MEVEKFEKLLVRKKLSKKKVKFKNLFNILKSSFLYSKLNLE